RFGPTPTIEMALNSLGLALANPFVHSGTPPGLAAGQEAASARVHGLTSEGIPAGYPRGVTAPRELAVTPAPSTAPPRPEPAPAPPSSPRTGTPVDRPLGDDFCKKEDVLLRQGRRPPRPPIESDILTHAAGAGAAASTEAIPPAVPGGGTQAAPAYTPEDNSG